MSKRDKLPEGMEGSHFLKDIDEPIRVFVPSFSENHHDRGDKVVNSEGNFGVGLEE